MLFIPSAVHDDVVLGPQQMRPQRPSLPCAYPLGRHTLRVEADMHGER